MSLKIYNTSSWPREKMDLYSNELTKAMRQIVVRFSDDITMEEIASDIASGRQQLWLILDEQQRFKAFVTTEISFTNQGKKRVSLCQLAGCGGLALADLIDEIEQWAKDIGADEICPIGRFGWYRTLANHGYVPHIIRYRKDLSHGK